MIRRTQAPKTPPSRPPPRRRRRPVLPMLRRAARWSALLALAGLAYGGVRAEPVAGSRQALLAEAADRVVAATASLGLVVNDIEVEGRETTDAATIMAALAAGAARRSSRSVRAGRKQQLENLPWVRSAAIERRLPGTLHVRLTERRPLALWQHDGKQELIDRAGRGDPGRAISSRFARLPTGRRRRRRAAMPPRCSTCWRASPNWPPGSRAAVRVDDRRWNLRIDNAIDVLLPEENPRRGLGAAGGVRTAATTC